MNVQTETKKRWALVDSTKIGVDKKYEPPLIIAWGVDSHSVGTQTITMGRTIIPPKGRNQRHYPERQSLGRERAQSDGPSGYPG